MNQRSLPDDNLHFPVQLRLHYLGAKQQHVTTIQQRCLEETSKMC